MLTVEEPETAQRTASHSRRPTPKQRRAAGKALRTTTPLDAHTAFPQPATTRDALTLLEEQAADRVPNSAPSGTGGCSSPRSPSTAGPPG